MGRGPLSGDDDEQRIDAIPRLRLRRKLFGVQARRKENIDEIFVTWRLTSRAFHVAYQSLPKAAVVRLESDGGKSAPRRQGHGKMTFIKAKSTVRAQDRNPLNTTAVFFMFKNIFYLLSSFQNDLARGTPLRILSNLV